LETIFPSRKYVVFAEYLPDFVVNLKKCFTSGHYE
jgi:hypothetical protein